MAKDTGHNALIVGCKRVERFSDALPHDASRAAGGSEGTFSTDRRTRPALDEPDPFEHHLQEGKLHARGIARRPRRSGRWIERSQIVEDGDSQSRFDRRVFSVSKLPSLRGRKNES